MARIGFGVVTYNRPKYLQKVWKEVQYNVLPFVDEFMVYNDGSTADYKWPFGKMSQVKGVAIVDSKSNRGVAHAKNELLKRLSVNNDFIFIMEDDILPVSPKVIPTYLAAYKMTGIDHFMFAHHGPANTHAIDVQGPVVWWPSCVGAFTFYTKDILEKVGLMDENFNNAWEHVEHSWRILKSHKVPYGYWPDVLGSETLLKEIPGSIDKSSIGGQETPARLRVIVDGLLYWKKKDKDFPAQHTLEIYQKALKEAIEND